VLFVHALNDRIATAAMRLNIRPACVCNTLDTARRLLNVARSLKQSELALVAKLVLMRLHAQREPALTGCNGAAEVLQPGDDQLVARRIVNSPLGRAWLWLHVERDSPA
jgi:hypothetical protein